MTETRKEPYFSNMKMLLYFEENRIWSITCQVKRN